MANNSNSITLIGNLTRDPELRFTNAGRPVASFRIAVNRRYMVNNEWQDQTSYFDVTAWGDLGENAAATLQKGSRAIVFGRLEQRDYETREGEKRSAIEVVAEEVAPSLRWARATIERTERSDGGGGSRGGSSSGGGGGGRGPAPVDYGDEEPF